MVISKKELERLGKDSGFFDKDQNSIRDLLDNTTIRAQAPNSGANPPEIKPGSGSVTKPKKKT